MLMDVKDVVKDAAVDAASVLFECCQNKDLDPYLDRIIDCLQNQELIPACVEQLAEIVFVQAVETQALAVVIPILTRGLRDRSEKTKRRACVIVDNMCKLVPNVAEIQPFLPELMPLITRVKDTCSDPEVRNVA